jgi:hypothetical protein
VDKFMHLFSGMDSIRKPTGQKASCPRPLAHQYTSGYKIVVHKILKT